MTENLCVSCLQSEMFPFTSYSSDQKKLFSNLMQCDSASEKLIIFLSSLSKATYLSKVHTNHYIRATGASFLQFKVRVWTLLSNVGHWTQFHTEPECLPTSLCCRQISDGESISENIPTSSLQTLPSTKRHAILANLFSSLTACESQIMECDLTGLNLINFSQI